MDLALVDRGAVARQGRRLEYFTIAYNSLEGLISIAAGVVAGSVSLVGFGLDSVIEVSSGAALLWRLSRERNAAERERAERTAIRLVGICFIALAFYVLYEAGSALLLRNAPESSPVGIAIAALSVVVMPFLARAKRRVAAKLESAAMRADSRQTDFCAYLSAILLAGLALNAAAGWWWADPAAGIVMVPIIAREGINALRGHACECDSCHG
jgi:divalent metal cation (Fe/Co/Zn/Cd) transporter